MAIQIDRLQERLDTLGMNPAQASRLAGLSRDTIRNIMRGQSKNARSDTISALARILQCSVPYLLGEEAFDAYARVDSADRITSVRWLTVLHEIGAGYWIQAGEPVVPIGTGPVTASDKYPGAAQWLERVLGNGADRQFQPGDLIHVVDAEDIGYSPRADDYVVLVREDAGREERSIRRVASATLGSAQLHAPTDDPRFAGAIEFPAPDRRSFIAGKVIGSYRSVD